MKVELCSYSGFKIYPGKGKLFIRGDSKVFRFINGKIESLFQQRIKPAKLDWTVVFRRLHKKGITEEVAKKRVKRVVRSQRAVVGATLDEIKAKKGESPAARAEARKKIADAEKAKRKEAQDKKKAEKVKLAAAAQKNQPKISKQQARGNAGKPQAKSR